MAIGGVVGQVASAFVTITVAQSGSSAGGFIIDHYMPENSDNNQAKSSSKTYQTSTLSEDDFVHIDPDSSDNANLAIVPYDKPVTKPDSNIIMLSKQEHTPQSIGSKAWEALLKAKSKITPKAAGEFFVGTLFAVGCAAVPTPGTLIGIGIYYGLSTVVVKIGRKIGQKAGKVAGDQVVYPIYYTVYPKEIPMAKIIADAYAPKVGTFLVEQSEAEEALRKAIKSTENDAAAIKTTLQLADRQVITSVEPEFTSALKSALKDIEDDMAKGRAQLHQFELERRRKKEQQARERKEREALAKIMDDLKDASPMQMLRHYGKTVA